MKADDVKRFAGQIVRVRIRLRPAADGRLVFGSDPQRWFVLDRKHGYVVAEMWAAEITSITRIKEAAA